MQHASRRTFLAQLGHGALLAAAGGNLATGLAAAPLPFDPRRRTMTFGADLERLVATMQGTAPAALMPKLVAELRGGTGLDTLVAAGAIANARAFAGEDYDGYHIQMALLPARAMAAEMPAGLRALPVLKVLYRNAARIQKTGGARNRLTAVEPLDADGDAGAALQRCSRDGAMQHSERLFRGMCERGVEGAFEALHPLVRDEHNVHRIVLAWRAWDVLPIVGEQHAHTVLRQFVRFCVDHEQERRRKGRPEPAIREVVPAALERHRLPGDGLGSKKPDDATVGRLCDTVFRGSREDAADAVAEALAAGFDPDAIGEAISLAANELLLHDTGRKRVHGASVGVHASDAANAWRHLARIGSAQNRARNLVAAAFHTGGQSQHVGRRPYEYGDQLEALRAASPGDAPLNALRRAIEARDQRAACAAAQLYGERELPAGPIFDLLLRYACSEDGALHAEKYYHTVREEYRTTRPALRWRRVVALARVTASQYGEEAPGYEATKRLLSS